MQNTSMKTNVEMYLQTSIPYFSKLCFLIDFSVAFLSLVLDIVSLLGFLSLLNKKSQPLSG